MPSFSNKQVTTLSFLFIALLMFVMPSAHAAGSRYCKVDHYHSGAGDKARSQAQAKRSADRAWSSFTAWEYGQHWGNISVAMDKNYSCSHPTTGWKCTVTAKPCKITGRSASTKRFVKKYSAKKKRAQKSNRLRRRVSKRRYSKKRYSTRRTARKIRRTTRRKAAKKWSMKW